MNVAEDRVAAIEASAEAAWRRHDYEEAARTVLEGYGTELYSFLVAYFHGEPAQADDVVSDFNEDFWRSLPSFQWRCSIRAWCYKLARSAASRHRRLPHNRGDRRVTFQSSAFGDEIMARARATTLPYLRSEVKNEFQRLRDKLTPEDQDLLILRVDRNLSWRDVAHALLHPDDDPLDDDQLRRSEAALRQRFAEMKKRLRRLAVEAGLL